MRFFPHLLQGGDIGAPDAARETCSAELDPLLQLNYRIVDELTLDFFNHITVMLNDLVTEVRVCKIEKDGVRPQECKHDISSYHEVI